LSRQRLESTAGGASISAYGTRNRLPVGVAILAILIGLFGLIELIAGLLLALIAAGLALVGSSASFGTVFFHSAFLSGILLFLLGIVLLVVARSLWELEMWALALTLLILLVIFALDVISGNVLTLWGVVDGILIVYLLAVSGNFS
jgi:hypothetical protein